MPALFQASVADEDDDAWAIVLGDVEEEDDDEDDDPAFAETLGLPSDFSREERVDYDLDNLASYELTIRIGIAFDYLDAVRLAVQHRASLLEYKKQNARTTKTNAHAQREIDKAKEVARVLATRYNDNYQRIVALRALDYDARADDTAGARLRRIDLDADLAIANMARARTLGDSKLTPSWIWSRGDLLTYWIAADVAQWYRAKAEKDRADEAVNRICADFRRTIKGYGAYARLWRDAAARSDGGKRAYALKTAAMWEGMKERCARQYEASRRAEVAADVLDQTRVSDNRTGQ
ncbi:hypothetical protein C8Q73DRAFT_634352 [Cubamyces lactineus]|nr:hypothetical protein C8Q73DRAFT_634352 [Cubamyces lactineus]